MLIEFLFFLLGKITFFTGTIFNGTSFPKPLKKEEEAECITRMLKGDREAKEKLINHNMRLVAHVVKKYSGAYDSDDLISVGSIGLIKAINTYDYSKGTQLATYTARCIENEILMLIRSNKKYKADVSLSEPVGSDKDGNELTLMDVLCQKEDSVYENVHKSIEAEKLVEFMKKTLDKREFKIMCLRYGIRGGRAYAQREVACFLKISRSYISRIEKRAIEKLKEAVKKEQFYC